LPAEEGRSGEWVALNEEGDRGVKHGEDQRRHTIPPDPSRQGKGGETRKIGGIVGEDGEDQRRRTIPPKDPSPDKEKEGVERTGGSRG